MMCVDLRDNLNAMGSVFPSATHMFTIPTSLFNDTTLGVFVRLEFTALSSGDEVDLFVDDNGDEDLPLSTGTF